MNVPLEKEVRGAGALDNIGRSFFSPFVFPFFPFVFFVFRTPCHAHFDDTNVQFSNNFIPIWLGGPSFSFDVSGSAVDGVDLLS